MVYNSRLQTRVTHGRHETSPLRLQLLGNGDILSLENTEAFIAAAASVTADTYTQEHKGSRAAVQNEYLLTPDNFWANPAAETAHVRCVLKHKSQSIQASIAAWSNSRPGT